MKLYHGTSKKYLPRILEEGLKPRGKNGTNNWKHSVGSNPKTIYLTDAYALYFAHIASDNHNMDMIVIEIDTDKLNPFCIMPDEDWLEQTSRRGGPAPQDKSMHYRTKWYRKRLTNFQHYWKESLEGLGTCGYLGFISTESITRYAIIPDSRRGELILAGMDPQISIMNYHILKNKYRNWIRWTFGDPLVNHEDHFGDADYMKKINREGIVVVEKTKGGG